MLSAKQQEEFAFTAIGTVCDALCGCTQGLHGPFPCMPADVAECKTQHKGYTLQLLSSAYVPT
jgi:hypothetical protein